MKLQCRIRQRISYVRNPHYAIDKKRVIVYLFPGTGFFKVAFVFGNKAMALIMESAISPDIKNALRAARAYAEGRGIRIDVHSSHLSADIQSLIGIKLKT